MNILNMFGFKRSPWRVLGKSFSIIEFDPTGEVLWANAPFCSSMEYQLEEIRGKHHSMFLTRTEAESAEYKNFWPNLAKGELSTGEFQRVSKTGTEKWLRASYSPVFDGKGKVVKVIKLALDVTDAKVKAALDASLLDAVSRTQAIVEFTPDGEILDANKNFLQVMGYGREEVLGRKHSMFLDADYAASAEYRQFWERLRRGEVFGGEFSRRSKSGQPVWLQATYNPVFDVNGRICKVVKLAVDLTERMDNVAVVGSALYRLAEGDLESRVDKNLMPSLDKLRVDFNKAADKLQSTLKLVAVTGHTIQSATAEIGTATENLSRRTEQQAASLEQTAAALDEVTTTVRKTADGAIRAREAVATARDDAAKSGVVVRQAVTAMGEIETSSKKIGSIIGVIDEIAFQTNLLALNAGVEAARAGDAGRGFAVVATEVRALAQRSADAAREIKALISGSGQQVNSGVALVGDAGQALERIASQVSEINEVIAEIAASAQEQATGLGEVNDAVNQMDQVTQQNAAMVEQTAAASTQLARDGESLSRVISGFKLGKLQAEQPQTAQAHPPKTPTRAKPQLRAIAHPAQGNAVRKPAPTPALAKSDPEWAEF